MYSMLACHIQNIIKFTMVNVQIELVFNASWVSVLNEVTIFNATFARQQVLICDNILWHNPLPPSLQALSIRYKE